MLSIFNDNISYMIPLVSVCCTTYNHENFISECLEGMVNQITTFKFEILVHDDASTDTTASIVRKYQAKYPELIYPLFQSENQYSNGRMINVRFNFPRAKGKYIAMCEGDDIWIDKYKLQKQIDFLEGNSDFSGCFTANAYYYGESGVIKEFRRKKQVFTIDDLIDQNQVPSQTVVYRKVDINQLPSWFGEIKLSDWLIHMINTNIGPYGYIDDVTAYYRIHKGGIYSHATEVEQLIEKSELFKRIINDKDFLPLKRGRLQKKYKKLLLNLIKKGNRKQQINYFLLYMNSGFNPISIVWQFTKDVLKR